jgi:hypothetical protein
MKKIVFVFAMFFLGQMTFAQAWEGMETKNYK